MLEVKEHNTLSTYQSRAHTEVMGSRIRTQFRYDINQYLPEPDFSVGPHLYSFGGYVGGKESRQEGDSKDFGEVWLEVAKKEEEIARLKVELAQKQRDFEQKIAKMTVEIQTLTQNYSKVVAAADNQLEVVKNNQGIIKNLTEQRNDLADNLDRLKKKSQQKTKNIRIFCQKYDLSFEPNIEVQTEPIRNEPMPAIVLPEIARPLGQVLSTEFQASRKISCSSKPQFYQLYQQQQYQQQEYDLNNAPTSRSQVFPSGLKPKKPALMQNHSELASKQNNRNRINQILQETKPQDKPKPKIKNQQIQLYPIDSQNIQDIVSGILALK